MYMACLQYEPTIKTMQQKDYTALHSIFML